MIDKELAKVKLAKELENNLRQFIGKTPSRKEVLESVSESLHSFYPAISQQQEEIYGPLTRLSNNDSIEFEGGILAISMTTQCICNKRYYRWDK